MNERRAWSIARFPEPGIFVFVVLLWLGFFVVVVGITGAIAIIGEIRGSAWERATQLPRWFAGGVGFWLTGAYLRVYVAHGRTRRDFMRRASVFMVVLAAVLAALTTLGYLLELALYRIAGWPQTFSRDYLFDSASQVGPILLTYLPVYLVWTVVGALLSATHHRRYWYWWLITIPIGTVLVMATENAVDAGDSPLLNIADVELTGSVPLPLALAVGIGGFAVGLAATWALAREMPLREETA